MEASDVILTESLIIRAAQRAEIFAKVQSALVVNFPSKEIISIITWYEFLRMNEKDNKDIWMIKILYLLSEVVHNKFVGTFCNSEDEIARFFLPNGLPKFLPMFEVLFSETISSDEDAVIKDPVGMRLWLFSFDPAINFDDAIASCINQNSRLIKKKITFHGVQKMKYGYLDYCNYTTSTSKYITEITDQYTEFSIPPEDETSEILKSNSKYQPKNIFSVVNSFKFHCNQVCSKQKTLSSYFSSRNFIDDTYVDFSDFTGFPYPDDVWYMPCTYFKPQYLYFFPLISYIGEITKPAPKRFNDENHSISEIISDRFGYSQFSSFRPSSETNITREMREDLTILINNTMAIMTGQERRYGISEDEVFAKQNAVIRHKIANHLRYRKWRQEQSPQSFLNLREDYTRKNVHDFWNELMSSKILPPSTIAVRDYWLEAKKRGIPAFAPSFHIWKDVSFFASTQIFLNQFMESVADFRTSFIASRIAYLVSLSSASDPFEESQDTLLPAHLLFNGSASVGKSFVLDFVLKLLPPGFAYDEGTKSLQAQNTGGDWSGGMHYNHEGSAQLLGASSDGKVNGSSSATDAYSDFKHSLSNNGVLKRTICAYNSDNERTRQEIYTNNGGAMFILTNTAIAPNNPTTERFLDFYLTQASRDDKKASDLNNPMNKQQLRDERNYYITRFRMLACIYIFTERSIQAGYLLPGSEVNLDVFSSVWSKLCEVLRKYNFTEPGPRKKTQIERLARTQTILYAIQLRMGSTLGNGFAFDEKGDSKPFDIEMLYDIRENLFCTEEIAIYIISLMSFVWFKSIRRTVVRTLLKRDNITFPLTNKNYFLEEVREQRLITDYRYISISFQSKLEMVDWVCKNLPEDEQYNHHQIENVITDLLNTKVASKRYQLVSDVDATVDDDPIDHHKDQEDLQNALSKLKGASTKDFAPIIRQAPQKLQEIDHSPKENIEVMKFVPPRDNREKKYTIALAVEFCKNLNTIDERGILREVAEYNTAIPGKYIVALPFRDGNKKFHHILDVIDVRPSTKPRLLTNPAVRSSIETQVLASAFVAPNKPAVDTKIFQDNFILDVEGKNLDFYAAEKHVNEIWGQLNPEYSPSPDRLATILPSNVNALLSQDKRNSFKFEYPKTLVDMFKKKVSDREVAAVQQKGIPISTITNSTPRKLEIPILTRKRNFSDIDGLQQVQAESSDEYQEFDLSANQAASQSNAPKRIRFDTPDTSEISEIGNSMGHLLELDSSDYGAASPPIGPPIGDPMSDE